MECDVAQTDLLESLEVPKSSILKYLILQLYNTTNLLTHDGPSLRAVFFINYCGTGLCGFIHLNLPASGLMSAS